jgi:cell division protein FtsW
MVSRAERTLVSDWWRTIDHLLLAALGTLMLSGLVFLMGGGPPAAERLGLSTLHFINRQVVYLFLAVAILVGVAFLSLRHVRRVALLAYVVGIALCVLALHIGPEIKGAHRWVLLAGFSIQPSELVKPTFAVLTAWALSESARHKDMPGSLLAVVLLPATTLPLILQPDFGQTILIAIVWCAMFFVAGLHWLWVAGFAGAGLVGLAAAYQFVPHVRGRIERFFDKSSGDSFQIDMAMDAFAQGGWLGKGPGEGSVKRTLPDAHTDFIFAVTAEEFGIVVCLAVVSLFALIVLRGLWLARRREDSFSRLAVTGLLLMFGLQATINMAVNVHLLPAKGMTLPFISYGGSSLLSLALGMGFLIALTRRRPRTEFMDRTSPAAPALS